jgi:hypothetical protein
MSSPTPSPGENPLKGLEKLFKPRSDANARSIFTNVGDTCGTVWASIKSLFATTVDAPLGIAEAAVAGANNSIGYISQQTDRFVVSPINSFRSSIYNVFTNPGTFLSNKK